MKTNNAVDILRKHVDADPELKALVTEARMHRQIAELIRNLREAEGISQQELAARIHTSQSTIARLEDPDYGGHSLSMLARVMASLGRDIEVRAPKKALSA
jgi:ribosome-binding protein aMBF1 (putative translation factor)